MNRKLFALACGNPLGRALRDVTRRWMTRIDRPSIIVRGESDSVGIRVTMRDRNGRPYVSVDIVRLDRLCLPDPSGYGTPSDRIGDHRKIRNGSRSG